MPMTKDVATFKILILWRALREDFAGMYADVAVGPDGLTFKGDEKGFFHLPFSRIARIRPGFIEAKGGGYYETKIWVEGERGPMTLRPPRDQTLAPYAAAMRLLASRLEKDGKLARVHVGVSKFEALLPPLLTGPVAVGAFLVAGFAMHPPEWWHFIVIPAVPTLAFGVLTWQAVTRRWPRPARTLADIEPQLPR
jgi:hypothetical protein